MEIYSSPARSPRPSVARPIGRPEGAAGLAVVRGDLEDALILAQGEGALARLVVRAAQRQARLDVAGVGGDGRLPLLDGLVVLLAGPEALPERHPGARVRAVDGHGPPRVLERLRGPAQGVEGCGELDVRAGVGGDGGDHRGPLRGGLAPEATRVQQLGEGPVISHDAFVVPERALRERPRAWARRREGRRMRVWRGGAHLRE